MEPHLRQPLIGRALAAALLAGVLALAWLQSRSPLARALAEGRPVLGWLRLDGKGPELFLTVYQPVRRTLELVYLPGETSSRIDTLVPGLGLSTGLPLWHGERETGSDEPPLDAADWVARLAHEPRSWPRALSRAEAGESPPWPWFDRLLLALELQRLGPQDLRPAWLPPEDQAGALLSRLILGAGRADGPPTPEHITVEVLNASGQPGIASRAKNILRLQGADVMSVGNVAAQARTVVYDRTGRFEDAAAVARMLDCPAARPLTKVDLKRLVDVSVVLAEDCPLSQPHRLGR
ncbi:MAG: LytR C-terminal domain-containing protein [Elusimicrobia bacterium]|nr:LytR C-terminal domain-containing protein [Elusimicrobiota bacterium]